MDRSSVVQILLLVVAVASLLWLRRWSNGRLRAAALWPPGPRGWPVIGHLHLLGELPHQSLCKLSKTYGPLMGLRLGGVPTIVASSPQMASQILRTHDLTFANRPRIAAAAAVFFDCNDIAFGEYGPAWRRMRQLCATELFNAKRLASFRGVREEEARDLASAVAALGEGGRQALEPRQSLMAASNNIISQMIMGEKVRDVCAEDEDLEVLATEMRELLALFNVGDFIPWLGRFLYRKGYVTRLNAARRRTKALMQHVLRQRRQGPPRARPHDLLDSLLAAASAVPSPGVSILTDDNIMGLVLDLFTGATDTSAISVEWALANLINNPNKMQKLQDELDSTVGKERLVSENDIEKLPYLSSVLKETMRLHPPGPLLLPRESTKECQIGAYTIPARSWAYVNAWAIARDGSVWERPLEFLPERFYHNDMDLQGKHFGLLPFGFGRRSCPGWALGILNVHIMLATMVQAFDWALPSPDSAYTSSTRPPLLDMSEKFGLTLTMAKPLRAYAAPRLPRHVY